MKNLKPAKTRAANKKNSTTIIATYIALIFIVAGCENRSSYDNGEPVVAASDLNGDSPNTDNSNDGNTALDESSPALAKIRKASIIPANRILSSMVACTGVREASAGARKTWGEKLGTFSKEGDASSVSSPMMSAVTTLSADICFDLITQERNQEPAERRIFTTINFDTGADGVDEAGVSGVVRRMARSCWGRNETSSELEMISQSSLSNFTGTDVTSVENQMTFVCSSMLSSLAFLEM